MEENVWSLRLRAAKIPFIIIGGYYVLSLIIGLTSFPLYESIFMSPVLVYVVLICGFVIGAYVALVDYNIPKKRVVQGGLLAGLGIGLISAIAAIILLNNTLLMERSVSMLIAKAAEMGASVDELMARTQIMLGAYVNFAFGPIYNGGLGALFAWIGVMVTNKFESNQKEVKKK